MATIEDVVRRHRLGLHPEGGWYREVHRSPVRVSREALPPGYPSDRCVVTSILFLLGGGQRSRRHRVRSEEIWLHHEGDDLLLSLDSGDGSTQRTIRLGSGEDAKLQAVVPAGTWQSAAKLDGAHGYVLVGCVVAPGFEYEDFEIG